MEQALALARRSRRRLDEARCLLRLSLLSDDGQERLDFWRAGEVILQEIGAEAWLNGRSAENPPALARIL
jgi:hypothetical protein